MHQAIYTLLSVLEADTYPGNIPQGVNPPFINFKTSVTEPSNTKSGASEIDFITLVVDIYHTSLNSALSLAGSVRSTLDYYTSTTITSIVFENQSDDFSFDSEFSMIRQQYRIREKR